MWLAVFVPCGKESVGYPLMPPICLQLETGSWHYSVTMLHGMIAVCRPINSATMISPNNSATKASYCVSVVTPQSS